MGQNNHRKIVGYLLVQRAILFLAVHEYLSKLLPHAVIQAGTNAYEYDANGNMSKRKGVVINYDYDNRPTSIGGTAFVYDYSGQRVKKNSTIYIGKLYECNGSSCIKYIFAGSGRVASKSSSATYYYHTDHLGSSTLITDMNGNKAQETYYYPFGETRYNWGNATHYKFTGQEEDAETGLYYYGARYYDPVIGRFISPDSIVQDPFDPQTLNRYSYCINNPLIYTDPTGHFVLGKFLESLFSGFVGGVVAVLTGNPFLGIMAVGATYGAMEDGVRGAIMGAVTAGFLGGVAMINPYVAYAILAGGAAYAGVKGGLNGLAYYAGGVLGGMIGYSGASYIQKSLAAANAPAYKQYAEAYTSDAGTLTSQDEINELSRLTYAEGAGQYKVDNAMEGIAWVVRNRVETEGWPDTYYGVIHQKGQFASVGGKLWNAAGDPSSLTGSASAANSRALTVATGVYNGTIADPTGGALYFQSGPLSLLSARAAAFFRSLIPTVPIGSFSFYK